MRYPNLEQIPIEWQPGDVILDLYEVKEVHLGGGMGIVYRVLHQGWNIDLAVKCPRESFSLTKDQISNFTIECETWINLGLHPYVVSCYYVRTLGSIPRVFAEYLDGGTLKDWINNHRLYIDGEQKTIARILDIAIQMCWGVQHAHTNRIIHKDIKPGNVMMSNDGTAKISDFGLAIINAKNTLPKDPFVGYMTPEYCSPEQANGLPICEKTDIWSLAVTILEMFVGEICWTSGIAAPHFLKDNWTSTSSMVTCKIPQIIKDLLMQCLEPNVEKRIGSASELATELIDVYVKTTGTDYPRLFPDSSELSIDSLNNRAVSLLDIGREKDAVRLWKKALRHQPDHPYTLFNYGIYKWRNSQITDHELIMDLHKSCENRPTEWIPPYLLAFIHAERGDVISAIEQYNKSKTIDELFASSLESLQSTSPLPKLVKILGASEIQVTALALSSDARFVALATKDLQGALHRIQVWDVLQVICITDFSAHGDRISSLSISGDNKTILSASFDQTIQLWEIPSGRKIKALHGHNDKISSAVLSSDGKYAASIGRGEFACKVWDTSTRELITCLGGDSDKFYCLAISRDSNYIITGGSANISSGLKMWEVPACVQICNYDELPSDFHPDDLWVRASVNSLACSSDGEFVLAAYNSRKLGLWETKTGKCVKKFNVGKVHRICMSSDGRWSLTCGDSKICVWENKTGRCIRTLTDVNHDAKTIAFSADGSTVATAAANGPVRIWTTGISNGFFCKTPKAPNYICRPFDMTELVEHRKKFEFLTAHAEQILKCGGPANEGWKLLEAAAQISEYSHSDKLIRLRIQYGTIGRRTSIRSAHETISYKMPYNVYDLAISDDGSVFCTTGGRFTRITNSVTGDYNAIDEYASALAISNNGEIIATGYSDGKIIIRETQTNTEVKTLNSCEELMINHLYFTKDGQTLISGASDYTVRIWDIKSGNCISRFNANRLKNKHLDVIFDPLYSFNCRYALLGSGLFDLENYSLQLWDLKNGNFLHLLSGHSDRITSINLSANDDIAVSSSADGTMRLWNLETGICLRTLNGHNGRVSACLLTDDGRFVVSGGAQDGTIRVWEVATGKCLRIFSEYSSGISHLCLSSNGGWLLSAQYNKTIRLLRMDWNYKFD